MWKKLDQVQDPPYHFDDEDRKNCIFAREFTAKKDYKFSETNGLIKNLKMEVSIRQSNPNRWHYKGVAINRFASELIALFNAQNTTYYVTAIPTSKRKDDAEYDDRSDQVIKLLCKYCNKVKPVEPIFRNVSMRAKHLSGDDRPKMSEIAASLAWDDTQIYDGTLVLIDDVVTTGAEFKVCQAMCKEKFPNNPVLGLFWALTVRLPEDYSDVDLSGLLGE